jgi:crossover junction endodeoxyribonuclease RuvC
MNLVGIDPGASGALALIVDGELTDVIDVPAIDKRINVPVVTDWFREWQRSIGPIHRVIIENVHAMPKQGVTSSFNFGRALGAIEAVPQSLGLVTSYATPAVWKRSMGLIGKDKAASRQLATDIFPSWAAMFKRVKDDGRAEACLLAKFGAGL